MSFFYPSITSEDSNEPFELQVSRNQIAGHRAITVFGYNPDVDQTEVTVWPYPGIVSYPAVAAVVKVSSTSTLDTSGGTGARTVTIQGLDADYNEITEVVTMNGQTAVNTVNSYRRVNFASVTTVGSTLSAQGDIFFGIGTVTAGVPATVFNLIKFDYNNTVTGHYTVPAGYTAYLMQGNFSAGQDAGTTGVRGRLLTIDATGIRRTAAVVTVNNASIEYPFEFPIAIPEKTDIEATATGQSSNNQASILYVMLLVKGAAAPAPGTPRI